MMGRYFIVVKKNGHLYPNINGTTYRIDTLRERDALNMPWGWVVLRFPLKECRALDYETCAEIDRIDAEIAALRRQRADVIRKGQRRKLKLIDLPPGVAYERKKEGA